MKTKEQRQQEVIDAIERMINDSDDGSCPELIARAREVHAQIRPGKNLLDQLDEIYNHRGSGDEVYESIKAVIFTPSIY